LITPLTIDSDYVAGIQMQIAPRKYIYIFQVYLPCVNHSNQIYCECLNNLYDLYNTYCEQGETIFLGDFNADIIFPKNSFRNRLLSQFAYDCNLYAVNTHESCIGPSNSYVSYDDRYSSLIDYVFVPTELLYFVTHCEIADDVCLNVSRHRPILCCLNFEIHVDDNISDLKKCINWKAANSDHGLQYCDTLCETLS